MYNSEDFLQITHRVGVTREAYEILRQKKRKEKISLSKIVTNLILEKYGE